MDGAESGHFIVLAAAFFKGHALDARFSRKRKMQSSASFCLWRKAFLRPASQALRGLFLLVLEQALPSV